MSGQVAPTHGKNIATAQASTAEQTHQTPIDHARVRGPHSVKFVELCSCLGSFSNKLSQLGAVLVGFAEPTKEPVDLFKHKYPKARHTEDLYDVDSFKAWHSEWGDIDLMVLGPSCKSFSVAGKQDWNNPRARHAPDSSKAAQALQPLVVSMEITKELQTNDASHGLYSQTMDQYREAGYELASAEQVRDSELGGCQSRHRLIVTWDRKDVHGSLPPIPPLSALQKTPCPLLFSLLPLDNIPDYVWLWGQVHLKHTSLVPTPSIYPLEIATITWGGPDTPIRPGSIVQHISSGAFWRVTSTKPSSDSFTVTSPDDPRNPACHEMSSCDVSHHA